MAKALTNTEFNFENQKNVYHGKVRDVYTVGDDKLVTRIVEAYEKHEKQAAEKAAEKKNKND